MTSPLTLAVLRDGLPVVPGGQSTARVGRFSFEGGQRQANLSAIESQGGTMLGMLAIAGTGYGLIGLLVIILLIVLIVYFARRA
jgi:hypothetical protein